MLSSKNIAKGLERRASDRGLAKWRTPSVFEQFGGAHEPATRPQGWPLAVETAQGGSAPVARFEAPRIADLGLFAPKGKPALPGAIEG